ncbi:hypothetical protein [Bosea sp. PAMC 26642]|uniref:hypothetical protein n=1 Tax=Bosea sp. (strain PAMC 26642) TaxID=1792307 RepID=UPI000B1B1C6D|nr:hypothetical protein [Bosea sp. PAMC 26642]
MREHRMLRSGPSSDVAKSPLPRRNDERQGALDLAPPASTASDKIERLSAENTKLKMQVPLVEGQVPKIESTTYRSYNPVHGWLDKVDVIAEQAAWFAKQLAEVTAIRTTGAPDETDAEAVNTHIAMVAEEADSLITALIKDAEAHDLEASGPWIKIPLVECQKFEAPSRDSESDQ